MIRIYKITNIKNGKTYVGQTSKSLKNRFDHHKHQNSLIGKAIRDEGPENFTIEEIMLFDNDDNQYIANEFEMFMADVYNSFDKGYNVKRSLGKCGGDTLSNHPNIDQISKKISESKMGDKNPMRVSGGLKGERNGMYGKTGKDNPNHRGCKLTNAETGEEIKFDSLRECQTFLGCKSVSPIFNRCNNICKTPFNGYYINYDE